MVNLWNTYRQFFSYIHQCYSIYLLSNNALPKSKVQKLRELDLLNRTILILNKVEKEQKNDMKSNS